MNEERFPCPCCGYRTYFLPAVGAMELCPVCFWEDAPGDYYYNRSNEVTLAEGQANFLTLGACEECYLDAVRSALPEEVRSPHWLSFEELRLRIIELIESVYQDVKREGGVTLNQREAIDDYATKEQFLEAAKKDPELNWKDIPDAKIRKLGMSLVFFDPRGIRFHLPAFMRCALRNWITESSFSDADRLLYSLNGGPNSKGYFAGAFERLNTPQRQAVAAFLAFVDKVDLDYSKDALKGLENGWDKWIPDFFRLSFL